MLKHFIIQRLKLKYTLVATLLVDLVPGRILLWAKKLLKSLWKISERLYLVPIWGL